MTTEQEYAECSRWFAERCGIEQNVAPFFWYELDSTVNHCGRWDIRDARCREIVREKYRIQTRWIDGMFEAYYASYDGEVTECWAEGGTIPDAEIACCLAIWREGKE